MQHIHFMKTQDKLSCRLHSLHDHNHHMSKYHFNRKKTSVHTQISSNWINAHGHLPKVEYLWIDNSLRDTDPPIRGFHP